MILFLYDDNHRVLTAMSGTMGVGQIAGMLASGCYSACWSAQEWRLPHCRSRTGTSFTVRIRHDIHLPLRLFLMPFHP